MRYLLLSVIVLCIAGCGNFEWFPNNYGNIPTQNDVVFTPQTGVKVLTQVQSSTFTVTGLTNPVAISVANGEYAVNPVNGGTFTSAAGTVNNNDTVVVRHTSSMAFNTSVQTTLTIGTKSGTFTSTTGTDPNFTFLPKSGAAGTAILSDLLTISGAALVINLSIVNGEYSIGGGAFTSTTSNTVNNPNGQTLQVRNTAAATAGLTETTTLTILNGTITLKGTFVTTAQ